MKGEGVISENRDSESDLNPALKEDKSQEVKTATRGKNAKKMGRLLGMLTRGRGLQAAETEWSSGLGNVRHCTEGRNKSGGVGFPELDRTGLEEMVHMEWEDGGGEEWRKEERRGKVRGDIDLVK